MRAFVVVTTVLFLSGLKSVPRDLYLPIAGTNFSDRVNAAFALGGPDQLVATVQRTLGVTIHHYVQVDFSGFKDIVDTVGGVTMYVPYPVRDSGSGLDLGRAGCWELDGNKGLYFEIELPARVIPARCVGGAVSEYESGRDGMATGPYTDGSATQRAVARWSRWRDVGSGGIVE